MKKRILIEDDWNSMQNQVDFCVAELLLRSDISHSHNWGDVTDKPDFQDVCFSGSYNDLLHKPTMPDAQIQSDWAQTNAGLADFIKNKPVRTFSKPSRSLNSAFQMSNSSDVFVLYTVPVTTVAALLVGSRARIILQYADNSGMSTNLVNVHASEFGIGSGLAVTGYGTITLCAVIPKNKYVRLVSSNVLGTPTFGTVDAFEVEL